MTFPAGTVSGRSKVLTAAPLDDGGYGVVTEETPFHPLDHTWPDQPGDIGFLQVDDIEQRVVDCVTGGMPAGGGGGTAVEDALLVGDEIPARWGDAGWHWLVVHVVERAVPVQAEVELIVNAERRRAFSAGHTACHLMALALNAALASRWRKDAPLTDGLGHPDFDALAIMSSRIVPHGSRDVYRVGGSLQEDGFTAEGLADALPEITAKLNNLLAGWIAVDAPVRIEVPSPELTARRIWQCELPGGTAEIPCGGTHLRRSGELSSITAELELSPEADELVVETKAAEVE
ncbi:alanyl-tRNA editing protein [Actinomadura rudentiformis]|uniref:Metal-dependent hydrolase n=1 Tax=Actinomadura rudentiformis TaxID=359158 RepID=A0A6H9YFJ7_9ACTN|nr:metal-dependent hydrolase [Actinomadura rudentiformis]KAB2344800.1 metal-dependent hydrolase [Actinomadura rudentiformis]